VEEAGTIFTVFQFLYATVVKTARSAKGVRNLE
jgi:hypothetical protein